MDLYRMNDEHDLPPNDLCTEAFQLISDILEPHLPDQSAGSDLFGDNLGDDIPLPCRTEEITSDPDMVPALSNKWDADIDLTGAEGSRLLLNRPRSEKCVQATGLDCKVCGKVFSNASSLNKHNASHSQERTHICKICKKGFKRQDHLMGHMLTHLKVKPFVCTEVGCDKSYCDFRSLKRHYEFHHGLLLKQQTETDANSYLIPSKVPEPTVPAPSFLPNNEIIRCLATKILQQKVTSNMADLEDPSANHVPQMITMNINKPNEGFTYTMINSSTNVSMDQNFAGYANPPPSNPLWNVPFPQSQTVQSIQNQRTIYSVESFHGATVNRGFLEPLAGHLQSWDHSHLPPLANNGQETMRAQNSFPHEPDFTRLTIQPCQVSENFFPPMINSQLHTATVSVSVPQCIPEPNGIRGWSDLKKNLQGLTTLSRITGATENVISGGQNGPATVQPGQGSQKLTSSSETWPKLRRSQCKSAIKKDKLCLHLSSKVPASQDVRERDPGCSQHKVEPTEQPLVSAHYTTAGQLVIPVSVPVTNRQEDKDNRMTSHQQCHKANKRKKTRPRHHPLYIPPPVPEKTSTSSGCFQSSMRSPDIQLSKYLHNGTIHRQYTPPPILSPIRQGTGLYFSSFCTPSSTKDQPPSLGEKDTARSHLAIDNTKCSVQPHINIGDRFQAVIPDCRDRSVLEREEEKADLVWRPCLHTEALSHVLNFACSSAVPGGGCNLELALHCLHFSQGNVLLSAEQKNQAEEEQYTSLDEAQQLHAPFSFRAHFRQIFSAEEALEKLLVKEHQKRLPPCLGDYHYAGSDHWSSSEKVQFKKAYYEEPKNFSYIQAMIPGKSSYQCVEYYYTWKKRCSFQRSQSPVPDQAPGPEQSTDGEEPPDNKETQNGLEVKSKDQNIQPEPKKSLCSQKETKDGGEHSRKFACQECNRVFDKMKSRNAHMKVHRMQEERERALIYAYMKQGTLQGNDSMRET